MKLIKHFFIILLSSLLFNALAVPEEIVLQNGLNQYNGCIDSYNYNENDSANYADSKTLEIRFDGC